MTFISKTTDNLTVEERSEMEALRELMQFSPNSVHPDKMDDLSDDLHLDEDQDYKWE